LFYLTGEAFLLDDGGPEAQVDGECAEAKGLRLIH